MINGILNIIAAVLFAVISMQKDWNMIWLCAAAVYLLAGMLNMIIHAVKNAKKQKAARKAEEEKNG